MDIFLPIRFRTSVQLAPSELHTEFITVLTRKLQKNLEGVCSRYGYIRPGSIEIVKRSAGQFVKQHFNGHIRFDMVCKAEVCNPVQGMILKAFVRNKNAMGLLAESFISVEGKDIPVLDIIVPKKAAGIASDIDLENVQVGEEIYVSVQGKRYQLNDKKISIIGRAVRDPTLIENINLTQDVNDEDEGGENASDVDDDVYNSDSENEGSIAGGSEDEEGDTSGVKKKMLMIEDEDDDVQGANETEDEDKEEYADDDDFYDEDEEVDAGLTGGDTYDEFE